MLGMMALMGYFGYVILAGGGGYLFDHWRANGPFILYAILMIICFSLITKIYNSKIKNNRYLE